MPTNHRMTQNFFDSRQLLFDTQTSRKGSESRSEKTKIVGQSMPSVSIWSLRLFDGIQKNHLKMDDWNTPFLGGWLLGY